MWNIIFLCFILVVCAVSHAITKDSDYFIVGMCSLFAIIIISEIHDNGSNNKQSNKED